MNKNLKTVGFILAGGLMMAVAGLLTLGTKSGQAAEFTNVRLTLTGGGVTIGATGTFNFGTFTVSSSVNSQEKQFTGSNEAFFVEDLKGVNSGYYTTLQITNLSGQATSGFIPSANLFVKTTTLTVSLITGTTNTNVVLPAGFTTYAALNTPVTFLKRDLAANGGKVGKYGVFPFLRIDIPAFQTVDTYSGTLTYTLYEN